MAICGQCGVSLTASAPVFDLGGATVCRNCHDRARPICPHCRQAIPSLSGDGGVCPRCRNTIVVNRAQILFRTTLLTPDQDAHCKRCDRLLARVGDVGLDQRHAAKVLKDHLQETGGEPSDYDAVRKLYYMAGKCLPVQRLGPLHRDEAAFIHASERDPHHVLRKAIANELEDLKARGATRVRLDGPVKDCHLCRKLVGDELPIEQALAAPLAPFRECPNRPTLRHPTTGAQRLHPFPFCQARYEPVALDPALAASPAASPAPARSAEDLLRPPQDQRTEEDERDRRVDPVAAKIIASARAKVVNGTGKVMYRVGDTWVDENNVPVPVLFMSHGDMKGVWAFIGHDKQGKAVYKQIPPARVQQFVQIVFRDRPDLKERRKTDPTAAEEIWQAVEGVLLVALSQG